jgi:hypothetical protein
VRWQPAEAKRSEDWSAAATPLFNFGHGFQSGVALRFPPQSKMIPIRLGVEMNPCSSVFIRG